MSLIKEKRFAIVLGGSTLVAVGALVWFAVDSYGKYDAAHESYLANAAEVTAAENGALYPTRQNQDQKTKALADYRDDVTRMQKLFAGFRPAELKNVTPQAFTDHLKTVDAALRKDFAFAPGGTKLPPQFYLGFDAYTGGLAKEGATGILGYQLDALSELFGKLAKARPSELRSVFRPKLSEEDGQAWIPAANCVARPLPIEITFKAPEKAVREFLSSIAVADKYYYVVRTMAVSNERQTAPTQKDAQFEKAKNAGGIFGDAIVMPGSATDSAAFPGGAAGASATPSGKPAVSTDSSRILKQVLGNEELIVFLRVDVLQFLPEKPLP